MSDNTGIEWTDATWNPVVGCSVVSPGCTNCYAMKLAGRLEAMGSPIYKGHTVKTKAGFVWNGKVSESNWGQMIKPLSWKRPRKVFVNSMSDLFHKDMPAETIDKVFAVMALCPQHTFQALTKRPERLPVYLAPFDSRRADSLGAKVIELGYNDPLELLRWPLPNVWIGASVEDQVRADERRDFLKAAADLGWNTWVSYEPALGPVDWTGWEFIKWMVSGGESGVGARPSHPDWHRSTRDWCGSQGVAYHFKQHGNWVSVYDRDGDDPDRRDLPKTSDDGGRSGRYLNLAGGWGFHGDRLQFMKNVGKKAAGRMLDGRTWDEVPTP